MTSTQQSIYDTLTTNQQTQHFAALLTKYPNFITKLQSNTLQWTAWVPCDGALNPSIDHLDQMDAAAGETFFNHLISPHPFRTSVLHYFPNILLLAMPETLNGPQLLRTRPTFLPSYGPTFEIGLGEAMIIEPDIICSNGIIHILDKIPKQPQSVLEIIKGLPPRSFSILHEALEISGFDKYLAQGAFCGATLFAPTNKAFEALGNTELKTIMEDPDRLRDLLDKHFSPNKTLYSNFYRQARPELTPEEWAIQNPGPPPSDDPKLTPKGSQTKTLPTAAQGTDLEVHFERFGTKIDMSVNDGIPIVSCDHMASNGVVHIVNKLLC